MKFPSLRFAAHRVALLRHATQRNGF